MSNAPQIIAQAGVMLVGFIAAIASHLPQILQKGIEIIGQLLAGIIREIPNLIGQIPRIILSIGEAFLDKDWGDIGLNIILGIASGVANAAGSLVKAAVDAAKNAVDTVKGWLGIKSPSRRMRDEVGKYMAIGMGVGFEKNIPTDEMASQMSESVKKMQKKVSGITMKGVTRITTGSGVNDSASDNYPDFDYERLGKEITKALKRIH